MNKRNSNGKMILLMVILFGLFSFALLHKTQKSTVLMIYMCGSDLESEHGLASADIQEMTEAFPEDGNLQVYVMAGGSLDWECGIEPGNGSVYSLDNDGLHPEEGFPELKASADMNDGSDPSGGMGNPETLTSFLDYCYEQTDADNYMLIFWDHGNGPMGGVCFDERSDMDYLTLEELTQALKDSPCASEKLGLIGFDACLMSSIEVAAAVAPYAEYMVASEEPEPANGWDYSFISGIPGDPSSEETGSRIVKTYGDSYSGSFSSVTLACIDLDRIAALLEALAAFFDTVSAEEDSYEIYSSACVGSVRAARSVPFDYDIFDMKSLILQMSEYGEIDNTEVITAYENVITEYSSNRDDLSGLGIYCPYYNKGLYASMWSERLDSLGLPDDYRSFLSHAGGILLGEQLAMWGMPSITQTQGTGTSMFTTALTDEEKEQFASADLVIVSSFDGKEYQFVYRTEDVEMSSKGILFADYQNEALFFVGKDGRPQTGAIDYISYGNYIAVPFTAYNIDPEEGEELTPKDVSYTMIYERQSDGSLKLIEIGTPDEDGIGYGKTAIDPEDWDILQFSSRGRIMPQKGEALPYSEWEYGNTLTGWEVRSEELGELEFIQLQDDELRCAFFEITDRQGNVHISDIVTIDNEYRTVLSLNSQPVFESDACSINLKSIESVTAGTNPSLIMTFTCENYTEEDLEILFEHLFCDSTMLPRGFRRIIAPGEKTDVQLVITADILRQMHLTSLRSISGEITVVSGDTDHEETHTFKVDSTIDLRQLNPGTEEQHDSGSAETWGDLNVSVSGFEKVNGNLRAIVHFENTCGSELQFQCVDFRLNEKKCYGNVDTGGLRSEPVILPAGCDAYLVIDLDSDDQTAPQDVKSISVHFSGENDTILKVIPFAAD